MSNQETAPNGSSTHSDEQIEEEKINLAARLAGLDQVRESGLQQGT